MVTLVSTVNKKPMEKLFIDFLIFKTMSLKGIIITHLHYYYFTLNESYLS